MRYSSLRFGAAVGMVVVALIVDAGLPGRGATEARATAADGRHIVVSRASEGVPADLAQRVSAVGGAVEATYPAIGMVVVTGLTDAAAASVATAPDIGAVLEDITITGAVPAGHEEPVMASGGSAQSATNPATAAFFPRQWNLKAIGADRAWAAGHLGSPGVTVAIVDSGIDYSHVDLAGRVDLSRSKSFVPSDDALVAANFPGKHPVTDLRYHGTHVAATVSSNAIAAAGVTSGVTPIGVKVLNRNGSGPISGILAGLLHAVDKGADVINLSLGTTFQKDGNGQTMALLNRAVTYAHRQRAIVVVSAGNDTADLDHDGNAFKVFCSSPTVICVAATGPTDSGSVNGPFVGVDTPAPYSNYGRSAISVAAPGGNQRPVWAACSRTSLVQPVCQTGNFVVGVSGTSQAAPHATGLAALLVEKIGKNPDRIRSLLQQSADDLGEPGTDPYYGKGRINVARALGLS
jgi:lantibiotic leader peptide-processing serine protease